MNRNNTSPARALNSRQQRILRQLKLDYQYYLLLLPAVAWYLIFAYGPLYGLQIAFKNFTGARSILDSPWVGLRHFKLFIGSYYFPVLIKNTLAISLYALFAGMPIPVIVALMLNEVKQIRYKKIIQTVTYAPHFISTVVLVGMITIILSPSTGIVNFVLKSLGAESRYFMVEPQSFRHIYIWSGIWQNTGWSSIIYLAALSAVNPELHESAVIDGATRLQRIRYINIPVITPTFIILLILSAGQLMSVGYEKVLLMQNDLNKTTSNIISTYVYERGLLKAEYSFASAVGLFNNVINFILLIFVNGIARKFSDTSLF
ncbi:MAG: ABC transporter permease subunit [Kiritimatiellae bacterium]|nr:ABC transporter permease subunit [Kiritimatiellia bacterium]